MTLNSVYRRQKVKKFVCIICFIFVIGCSEMDNDKTDSYHYENPPPKPQEENKTFSKDVLYYIERNPSKYKGQLYAFRGEVIQASESGDIIVFQMLSKNPTELGGYDSFSHKWYMVEPEDDSFGPSLTVVFNQSKPPIIKEANVTVLGYMGGTIEGTNAFGVSIHSLTMQGIAVIVGGKIYYFNKDKEIIDKWNSGELFDSVDRSKPIKIN